LLKTMIKSHTNSKPREGEEGYKAKKKKKKKKIIRLNKKKN